MIKRKSLLVGAAFALALAPSLASAATVLRLAENQPEVQSGDRGDVQIRRPRRGILQGRSGRSGLRRAHSSARNPNPSSRTQAGVIDLARVNSVVLANVSPSMGVFTLPYIFAGWDHKYKVLDGDIGDDVLADLEDVGLIGFPFMDAGSRSFYTVKGKTIAKIEDLEGLKIRVQPAPISIRMMELLGAVPTPMNYGEVYSSLQTGVIDGAENDFVSYLTSAHYEVAPNYVEDGHLSPPAVLIMNKSKFDSLPADQQEAIKKAGHEAALFEREIMRAANEGSPRHGRRRRGNRDPDRQRPLPGCRRADLQ